MPLGESFSDFELRPLGDSDAEMPKWLVNGLSSPMTDKQAKDYLAVTDEEWTAVKTLPMGHFMTKLAQANQERAESLEADRAQIVDNLPQTD